MSNAACPRNGGSPVVDDLVAAELPTISVIVAVYNAAATLGECLESLLRIDHPASRMQILCVDNGSSDVSAAILARYAGRLTILHEAKRGPAAARNRGLRHASGELVAVTDADCVVDRAWLRRLIEPLGDPAVGIAGGTILSKRPCNSIEAFGEQIHDHDRAINEFTPPYVITMNWGARRTLIRELGGFNEDLLRGSDVDFSHRVVEAGYRLVYAPGAIVYHQNERTPWGLMREGYVHAYHAVAVRRLHVGLRDRFRLASASRPRRREGPHSDHLPPPRLTPLWAFLFELGKRLGRRRAAEEQR